MFSRWGCSLHLSSFTQAPLHPAPNTHTHHPLFHSSVPMLCSRGKRQSERGADVCGRAQGHVSCVWWHQVFDLINGTRLHCEPNRTRIKKLLMLKMLGVRGQPFHSLSESMPFDEREYSNMFPQLHLCWEHLGQLVCGVASSATQLQFYPHLLFRFSLLFVAIVPNPIIISIIISVTHPHFHSFHIYINWIMHPSYWII